MEPRQLEYFIAVAELRNFTRAAERCMVSQPSLSQQILKLERYLGVTLLDRSGRSVQLTTAGKRLLPQAIAILASMEEAERSMRDEEAGRDRVRLGAIPTIAPFLLPRALLAVRDAVPHAEVVVREDTTAKLLDLLLTGGVDLAVIALPWSVSTRVELRTLWREQLRVLVPRKHEFATEGQPVAWESLQGESLVTLTDEHCLTEHAHDFCTKHRVNPEVTNQAAQIATLADLVAEGLGTAFVPEMALAWLERQHDERLAVLPVAPDPPYRDIAIAMRASDSRDDDDAKATQQAVVDVIEGLRPADAAGR